MTLVLQIVLAVVVLVGLITVIMSVKNWHWAQMLLLLCIFFSSIGALVLGLEVFRIHRTFRSKIPGLEQQIAELELKIDALKNGTGDQSLAGRIFPEGAAVRLGRGDSGCPAWASGPAGCRTRRGSAAACGAA